MTASLKRTIGEGAAWISTGNALLKILGILYSILLLSQLSVYEYGVVELLLSIPPLLGFLSLAGLENVLVADMSNAKGKCQTEKVRYILSSYFSIRFLLACIGTFMLFFAADVIARFYNESVVLMIQLLSITFVIGSVRSVFLIVFNVNYDFHLVALYRFAEELIRFLIILTAFVWFTVNPLAVIIAYVFTDIVTVSIFIPAFYASKKRLLGHVWFSEGFLHPLYILKNHGKWSIFQTYLGLFGQNIRPWIIKTLLGTQAVGIFALAIGMYKHTVSLFPLAKIVAPIIPRFLEKPQQLYKLVNGTIKYQMFILIVVSISVSFVMLLLVTYLFPDYIKAYPLYLAMLVSVIPASFSSIFETVFHGLRAQKNLFFVGVLRLVVILLLLPVSLWVFGLYGVAVELLITGAVYTYERYKKLKHLLPGYQFRLADLIHFSELDKMLLQRIQKTGQKVFGVGSK